MASYHYALPHYQSAPSVHPSYPHAHHGRNRRGPRVSSQNAHRQYKAQRSPKEELPQTPTHTDYLRVLEAAKSFEFDDDEIFCPFNLLTEDDLHSIHSSNSSDRGSLASNSPESSPLQHQVHPTSSLMSAVPMPYHSVAYQQAQHSMKLHQPLAQRTRNAIPIVDPSTRSVASPPASVSPGRQLQQQQFVSRHW